jgi:protoheme IX farnesyltransferase
MTASTLPLSQERSSVSIRFRAYIELTKPRIASLVLVTVVVSGLIASWGQPNPWLLLHAVIGTACVAASGSAFNQWLERRTDSLMPRTARRPLPAGLLSSRQVIGFATTTVVAGTLYLSLFVNWQAATWGLVTWLLYVGAYTPLKVVTTWNTTVGAVAGTLPVVIGWTAVGADFDLRLGGLLAVVFLWQFPHFMAIAWLYRKEYGQAGIKMTTVVDPSGKQATIQAVSAALALIPVSFLPASYSTPAVLPYLLTALMLGTGQLICALLFCCRRDEVSARWLLRASLIYLPTLLILMLSIPLL